LADGGQQIRVATSRTRKPRHLGLLHPRRPVPGRPSHCYL